jgi:hypothetical protein
MPNGEIRTYEVIKDVEIAEFPAALADWIRKQPSVASGSMKQGDQTSVQIILDRYLENLEPEEMFGIEGLVLSDVHNSLKSIGAYLIDEDRDWDEITDLLNRLGHEYGHRAPQKKDAEDVVQWFRTHHCKPMDLEPRNLTYPPYFYSSARENNPYPCGRCFYDETEYAVFKLRCSQTPAWAAASTHDDFNATDKWPIDPTCRWPDYEAWKAAQPPPAPEEWDWTSMFHTKEETDNAPPVTFAIEGFLQEGGITMFGSLAGHSKTYTALDMSRSLIEGSPLFGHFQVNKISEKVVYLIPESSLSPFVHRLRKFHLDEVVGKKFFYYTLSHKTTQKLLITDPNLLKFCKGADVILDTAVRFMEGDENASSEQKAFADNLFALIKAGARTVTGLHHSSKGSERAEYMSLENVLRGSGDIGAMLSTCWGLRQIDKDKNQVYIANCKPRDFAPCGNFIIQGRPSIDNIGHFEMLEGPGIAEPLEHYTREGRRKGGRPEDPKRAEKLAEALKLKKGGMKISDIATKLKMSRTTLSDWIREHEAAQKEGAE